MKENVIFTDFEIPNNWEFINILNKYDENSWFIENKINNKKVDNVIQKVKRYLVFIFFPFSRFLKRKKYSKIIAWQQFYGLMFAFFCNVFKVKKVNRLVIMTFIYTKKNGIIGKIKRKFIDFSISNKYVDKIIVFSKNEINYYSSLFPNAKEKFVFINLGVDILDKNIAIKKGDYFVTSGKSNRDYQFLIDAFSKIDEKLKIISYTSPDSKSQNVEVLNNVFDKEYYKYLAESFAVIVSLDDINISSGQLVFIHAMQLGKPIICTKSNTIEEYVIDNENGIVINKNLEDLIKAIDVLKNDSTYNRIAKNSYNLFLDKFSIKIMAKNILHIINTKE